MGTLSATHPPPLCGRYHRFQPLSASTGRIMRDKGEFLFTPDSGPEVDPNKGADSITDPELDACLAADPYARVACETMVTTNRIILSGETRGPEHVTHDLLSHLARMAVRDIGYDQAGFSWKNAEIEVNLHAQSSD